MDQWVSKEEVGDIDVFVAHEIQTPSGLDEELKNALMQPVRTGNSNDELIRSLEDLVGRGASISRAGGMQALTLPQQWISGSVRKKLEVLTCLSHPRYKLRVAWMRSSRMP
jgi:hypothetical protein